MNNLKDIINAVNNGLTVCHKSDMYHVQKNGKYYDIVCTLNDNRVGLTWLDGTFEHDINDFFIKPLQVNAHQECINDIDPVFLDQFTDLTYGNDMLAIFKLDIPNTNKCLILHIDYPDPKQRETSDPRFSLFFADIVDQFEYENTSDLSIQTDDFNELKKEVNNVSK